MWDSGFCCIGWGKGRRGTWVGGQLRLRIIFRVIRSMAGPIQGQHRSAAFWNLQLRDLIRGSLLSCNNSLFVGECLELCSRWCSILGSAMLLLRRIHFVKSLVICDVPCVSDARCVIPLLGAMILRKPKLPTSNLMTQLVQESKRCKRRDAMRYESNTLMRDALVDAMILRAMSDALIFSIQYTKIEACCLA